MLQAVTRVITVVKSAQHISPKEDGKSFVLSKFVIRLHNYYQTFNIVFIWLFTIF